MPARVTTPASTPRRGRPPFVSTEQQRKLVMALCAVGHTQETMAVRIGVNVDTLRKYFRTELEEGTNYANAALGEVLYRKALGGDVRAIADWYDRRGGSAWRKITGSEHAGPDGAPLQLIATARRDLSHFTEDELEAYHRLTAKLEAPNAAAR